MKILFDQGTPAPLRAHLASHTVDTAYEQGWAVLQNSHLLQAAEEAFALLAGMPKMGRRWASQHERLKNVRVWRVKGFENWLIFYLAAPNGVEILRVLHGARDIEALMRDETR